MSNAMVVVLAILVFVVVTIAGGAHRAPGRGGGSSSGWASADASKPGLNIIIPYTDPGVAYNW